MSRSGAAVRRNLQSISMAPAVQFSMQSQQSVQAGRLTIAVRPFSCSMTSSGQTMAQTPLLSHRS
jgi:hypothetical protein